MAVNTKVTTPKPHNKITMVLAVVLLIVSFFAAMMTLPSLKTEAASSGLKTVYSCKDLTVKKYGSNWWTYSGNTRVSYTGIAKNQYGWWRTVNGKVDFNATGIYKNDYGWWRTVNGKVDFNATSVYKNEFGWWYCENGKVRFDYTGMKSNSYGSWRIEGGKVNFGFNGLAPDEYNVWYYFKDGKVDYTREGLVKNEYGTWYVKGGKVDFSYTGEYRGYTIENSKVVASPTITIEIEDTTGGTSSNTTTTQKNTTTTTKKTTSVNQKNLSDNTIITDKDGNVVIEDKGIVVDISKWNGTVDFKQLKSSGVKGVMMRACYAKVKDTRFDYNSTQCEINNINYGVYQFANFHYNATKEAALPKAKEQANYLLNLLSGKKIAGYVCLDLELESGYSLNMTAQELTDVVNYYCDIIQNAGYKPMVYCSVSWMQNNLVASDIHAPFWLAYYNDTGSYNFPNTGYGQYMDTNKGKITMWQYTDQGDGSKYGTESEYVDLNRLYHSFTGETK